MGRNKRIAEDMETNGAIIDCLINPYSYWSL